MGFFGICIYENKECCELGNNFQSIKLAWKRMSVEPVFRLVLIDFEDAEVKAVIGEIGLERIPQQTMDMIVESFFVALPSAHLESRNQTSVKNRCSKFEAISGQKY
uniref:Uncharacterized protein n=1 Tax=Ditylenchus dipsaci TaxID=166011 RepID=A0A915CQV3_9BILA